MGGSRAISRWRSSSSTPVCRLPGTISGSRSASLEPDTNSKIYFTLSPEPRVRWDRRGILANPISGTAVLEYGPAEILPPVGAISKHPARLCRPGRQASRGHPRGKPGSRPSKANAGERRTVCWREQDSNPRSPVYGELGAPAPRATRPTRHREAPERRSFASTSSAGGEGGGGGRGGQGG